jgi:hypothetical protein
MAINSSEIEINPLSFAYVSIWKKNLTFIPPLDPTFCKSLFGSPQTTTYGFNINGLTIAEPMQATMQNNAVIVNKLGANLVLGYQRFSIYTANLDSLLSVYEKFMAELKKNDSAFVTNLKQAQTGINIEYELEFKKTEKIIDFLTERFSLSVNSPSFISIGVLDVRFQLFEQEKEKNITIHLQPRANMSNALFCSANDHYGISPTESIFTQSQLNTYITRSREKLKSQIIPFLINKV